jgi:MerR family transcriptional regulator, light-induced transcriptional regulator
MTQASDGGQVIDSTAFERAKGIFADPSSRLPSDAVQALASEVISRLSQRSAASDAVPEDCVDQGMDARIEALCHALLGDDEREATEIVMEAHAAGASVEMLYLGYLAVAARRLGDWWDDDKVGSVEVVIAAGRIYAIMRGLRRLFGPGPARGQKFRAVFASVPGETHVLGVAMAADLLTMHGWEIDLRAGLDHDTLVHEIGQNRYPIIGLSAGTNRMLFPLARLIVALRVSNPAAWILVSGPIADLVPDVVNLVDADASAHNLDEAEAMMEAFVVNTQRQAEG